MAQLIGKRFESPDEVREFTEGTGRVELVDLNGHAVGRGTFEPGWRWSQNVKPIAGTGSCQVDHIGYVLEGRMALKMDDGTEREFGPGDTFHMPPGHDAWIVGDETCVLLDFGGLKGRKASQAGRADLCRRHHPVRPRGRRRRAFDRCDVARLHSTLQAGLWPRRSSASVRSCALASPAFRSTRSLRRNAWVQEL